LCKDLNGPEVKLLMIIVEYKKPNINKMTNR
jgi:hypothetical protein